MSSQREPLASLVWILTTGICGFLLFRIFGSEIALGVVGDGNTTTKIVNMISAISLAIIGVMAGWLTRGWVLRLVDKRNNSKEV